MDRTKRQPGDIDKPNPSEECVLIFAILVLTTLGVAAFMAMIVAILEWWLD